MRLLDRSLRAAALVILALTFLGVLMSVYPIAGFSTQSVDKPIIPVWDPGDEEQTAEQTEDENTPTPTLLSPPTQSSPSEAAETAIDSSTSEVMEAALREPIVKESKKLDEAAKGDELLRGAFDNPADRLADPVLPKVESPPLENTITSFGDPALASTDQYPDVTAQPVPPQSPPPDSSVDTETFPQPSAPLDEMTSSPLPTDSPPFSEDL